jgi:hypothetical protein
MTFDAYRFLLEHGTFTLTLTSQCEQGETRLRFTIEGRHVQEAALAQGISLESLIIAQGPGLLPEITSSVHIIMKLSDAKEGQISPRLSAAECSAILKGKWPSRDTFSSIARAVRERKLYPMPKPEIPGGGGKSMTAQGQTKKEGSHSHDGGEEVPLFHPRQQRWDEHFRVDVESGELHGTTPAGRATVARLDLSHPLQLTARLLWLRLRLFPGR